MARKKSSKRTKRSSPSKKTKKTSSAALTKRHLKKIKTDMKKFERKMSQTVKKHPEAAALVSAAVGAALGSVATLIAKEKFK